MHIQCLAENLAPSRNSMKRWLSSPFPQSNQTHNQGNLSSVGTSVEQARTCLRILKSWAGCVVHSSCSLGQSPWGAVLIMTSRTRVKSQETAAGFFLNDFTAITLPLGSVPSSVKPGNVLNKSGLKDKVSSGHKLLLGHEMSTALNCD